MAWKLGFDAYRREASGLQAYKTFKPVPAAWFREGFETFMALMAGREGLPVIGARSAADLSARGGSVSGRSCACRLSAMPFADRWKSGWRSIWRRFLRRMPIALSWAFFAPAT